jgi:hypothetical protein
MRIITLGAVDSALDMFDGYLDTQTETLTQITQTFDVSGYNAVVLLNNYGISATLEVTGNDPTLDIYFGDDQVGYAGSDVVYSETPPVAYSETISLIRDSIKDWWDYFFAPSRIGRDLVWYFPETANVTATVTIDFAGDTAKCGLCLPGSAVEIGDTKYNGRLSISDYSVVSTNSFGLTYLSVGAWAKRMDVDVGVLDANLDPMFEIVAAGRATLSVFDFNVYDFTATGTSFLGYQSYIVCGFLEGLDPQISNPIKNNVNFEVLGVR